MDLKSFITTKEYPAFADLALLLLRVVVGPTASR
jgi:hypothetical protein